MKQNIKQINEKFKRTFITEFWFKAHLQNSSESVIFLGPFLRIIVQMNGELKKNIKNETQKNDLK